MSTQLSNALQSMDTVDRAALQKAFDAGEAYTVELGYDELVIGVHVIQINPTDTLLERRGFFVLIKHNCVRPHQSDGERHSG